MSKIKFIIEETAVYHHEVTVEGHEAVLEKVMDQLDKCDCLDDLVMSFRIAGCTICEVEEDDSGETKELEYYDEISLDKEEGERDS